MMRQILLPVLGLLTLSSCLRNDLDYPLVKGEITEFAVEGQKSSDVNKGTHTVTVELEETAGIGSLPLTSYAVSEGVINPEVIGKVGDILDLSKPMNVVLKTWQEYPWTIVANQTIERYVKCAKQAGDASFDVENHEVILYVTDDQPLKTLTINSMKLGPTGSKVVSTTGYSEGVRTTQTCKFPMTLDCVADRTFEVVYKDVTTVWTLHAIQTSVGLNVSSVEPWAYDALVHATFSGSGSPVVEYRLASGTEWIEASDAEIEGVNISVNLTDLADGENYVVRVKDGSEYSQEVEFTTDVAAQLPNSTFDYWNLAGKVWNPFEPGLEGGDRIWDTANKAVANWKNSITLPEEDFVAVSGTGKRAVKLESTYAVVKFASGVIFNGYFVGLKGIGAEMAWGTPFQSKPKALRGCYCYHPAEINYVDDEHASLKGQGDIAQIQILLTDWPEPFHVISTDKVFVDVKNDPNIIARGNLLISENNDGYQEFTIPLEYRDIRTPKYVAVVVASSYYGDYFTGGVGSTLYLDEFEFVY